MDEHKFTVSCASPEGFSLFPCCADDRAALYLKYYEREEGSGGCRLKFDNTPGMWERCDAQALLDCKLGPDIVVDVVVAKMHWWATFLRADEARLARRALDGYLINGRPLRVSYDDGDYAYLYGRTWQKTIRGGDKRPLVSFEQNLLVYLSQAGPTAFNDRFMSRRVRRAPLVVREMVDAWPIGFYRSRRDLRVVGRYLCVKEHEALAHNKCRMYNDAVYKEPWEPIAPSEISNQEQLIRYMQAFLKQFGPTWVQDERLWYVCAALPSRWALMTPAELTARLVVATPTMVVVHGMLYALFRPAQRRLLAAAVAP